VLGRINLRRVLNYQTASTLLTEAEKRSLLPLLPACETEGKPRTHASRALPGT
jgi:hypothetical protein